MCECVYLPERVCLGWRAGLQSHVLMADSGLPVTECGWIQKRTRAKSTQNKHSIF